MRYFLIILLCAVLAGSFSAAARANLKYYPDPVYKKLNADDHHPMDDMIDLAKQGDARAQFIMGDLYSKGKGGVAKDPATARHWFEESAIHGYTHSFIRLAALAKNAHNPVEAWQWYTLAIRVSDFDAEQKFAADARNELTEKAPLSRDDIAKARKSLSAWEDMRDLRLEAEKTLEEKEEKRAAEEKAAAELLVRQQPDQQPPTTGAKPHGQN